MNKQIIKGLSLFLLVVLLIIKFGYPNEERDYIEFHERNLEGIVSYNYASSGGVAVKINREKNKRFLYLDYNDNLQSFFSNFVVNGDSISKKPNGDYLYLFRGDKRYQFKTKKR